MFSIIVPIYNVENDLSRCLESILRQSYTNFEVILVNDGSTDHSGMICNKFSASSDKINVIHKANGGLSDARNIGITKANGDYIIFVDSDDYIESDTLKKFYYELNKSNYPDLMITSIKKVYKDLKYRYMDSSIPIELIRKGSKDDIIQWMFRNSESLWPSVRYIVKRSLISKYNLKFPIGYLHEDIDWTSKLFLYAKTFTASDFYWYNHRIGRNGSITSTKNPKRTLDVINLILNNIKNDEYNLLDIKLRNVIFQRMLKSLFSSLSDYKFYNNESKRAIIEILNRNKKVFKYTIIFKHKIFIKFCKIFGFRAGLNIMSFVHRSDMK